MRDVLANRIKDVAARPPQPDPLEERMRIDAERHRQLAARRAEPTPDPEPEAAEAEGGDPAPIEPDTPASDEPRYHVVQSGPWHKLMDRETGEQVGKSQRSEDAAWALLEEE